MGRHVVQVLADDPERPSLRRIAETDVAAETEERSLAPAEVVAAGEDLDVLVRDRQTGDPIDTREPVRQPGGAGEKRGEREADARHDRHLPWRSAKQALSREVTTPVAVAVGVRAVEGTLAEWKLDVPGVDEAHR